MGTPHKIPPQAETKKLTTDKPGTPQGPKIHHKINA